MTIPTPSDFAKLQTQRKQQESEREKLINSVEENLEKAERKKHSNTVAKNRKRFGGGESRGSHLSRKGKGPATSSKSEKSDRTSTRNPSSTKPSTPQKQQESATEPTKKPFVRKPHLTQRLSGNEELRKFRDSLPQSPEKNKKPRRTSTGSSSSAK